MIVTVVFEASVGNLGLYSVPVDSRRSVIHPWGLTAGGNMSGALRAGKSF